jgi:predicted phosphodiesterase
VRNFSLVILFLVKSVLLLGQTDTILHSIYLIGDTGKDTIPSEALQLLAFESFDDSSSTLLFLGDNCYPQGLNPNYSNSKANRARRVLESQYEILVGYRGNLKIIPGNHDWSSGKRSGRRAIEAQGVLADTWFKNNSIVKNRNKGVFSPRNGLPGPELFSVNEHLNILVLDSQWWLQSGLLKSKGKFEGMNYRKTRLTSLRRLDSLLAANNGKGDMNIIAAHHPLFTNGKHVHINEPMRSLVNYTPLKILGLLGLDRYFNQDLAQPRYRRYRRSMLKIMAKYPNTIFVSGHEHAMEYFEKDSLHFIVSGSGSKLTDLNRYRYPAHFMDDLQNGFFRITIHASGNVLLHAYGVKDRGEYWKTLLFKLPALD